MCRIDNPKPNSFPGILSTRWYRRRRRRRRGRRRRLTAKQSKPIYMSPPEGGRHNNNNIYCSKVRPIVEYAAPVWHSGLTREQSESLGDIQVRLCRIALPGIDYESALKYLEIPSLKLRRQTICKSLFLKMKKPNHKIFRNLPERNANRNKTRNLSKYKLTKSRPPIVTRCEG